MKETTFTDKQQEAARYAKAMGQPVRLHVSYLLSNQNGCFNGNLSDELPIAKTTRSQHLKELKDTGLFQGEIGIPRVKSCINKKNWSEAQLLFKEFLKI